MVIMIMTVLMIVAALSAQPAQHKARRSRATLLGVNLLMFNADLIERVNACDHGLPLEGECSVHLDECLDLGHY